jgi:hypothetical protein
VPLPSRDLADAAVVRAAGPTTGQRERALAVLLDPALAGVVALVCWRDGDAVHVADSRGHVTVAPDSTTTTVSGRDPLADQDPFSDASTAYPFPGPRLHSLFGDERAPDLAVVHSGDHWFVGHGGHPGEHGSLNGLQSRAPLVLSGAGVSDRGVVDRVARTVDVAATLAHLAGGTVDDMDGAPLELAVPGPGTWWDCCGTARRTPSCSRWRSAVTCPTSGGCSTGAAPCGAGRSRSSRASRSSTTRAR